MARRQVPDWLVYGVAIGLLVWGLQRTGEDEGDYPDTPAPLDAGGQGELLGPATPYDDVVVVEAHGRAQPGLGTAFSIDDDGVWLTARHVVEGCRRAVVLTGGDAGLETVVRLSNAYDIALLRTEGAPLPLTSALQAPLRIGQRAYHIGFPAGEPGEAATRLIGRETLQVVGRGERSEPLLAWAETGRSEGLEGSLAGLSGAPAIDAAGRVLGITVAESPRRGRIYTTAPDSLNPTLDAAGVAPPPGPGELGVTPDNYGEVADALRDDLRVAMVVCVDSD